MTIVMTTQLIDEAQHCDKLALINDGRVTHVGTPEELRQQAMHGEMLEVRGGPFPAGLEADLMGVSGLHVTGVSDGVLSLNVDDAGTAIPSVVTALAARGVPIHSVVPRPLSFDEAFTKLVTNDV
jgi:ABC-2 type transport system ATP-binding protein